MARPLCILNIPCVFMLCCIMLNHGKSFLKTHQCFNICLQLDFYYHFLFDTHTFFLTRMHWYFFVAMCCRTAHIILAFQMLLKKTNYCRLIFFEMPIIQCNKFLRCTKLSMHTCIFQQCVCRGSTLHISIYRQVHLCSTDQ